MHPGAVGVENTPNLDVYSMLAVIIKKQGFSASFALVIARTRANGVHIPPVGLCLRMDLWIAINLTGGRLEDLGLCVRLANPSMLIAP